MQNLKYIRNRISSIESTQKLTKAMHMISVSKFQKIKKNIKHINDSINLLSNVVAKYINNFDFDNYLQVNKNFFVKHSNSSINGLFVVFTTEKGLCGSINHSLVKKIHEDIISLKNQGLSVKLLVIGKKGRDLLCNLGLNDELINFNFNYLDYELSLLDIKNMIVDMIINNLISSCNLYYTHFYNTLSNIPSKITILPLYENIMSNNEINYYHDYDKISLIEIVELYITFYLRFIFIHSSASEESSRMNAMDYSTKNADDLLNELKLELNRSRQSIITGELIDIIGGAEAI